MASTASRGSTVGCATAVHGDTGGSDVAVAFTSVGAMTRDGISTGTTAALATDSNGIPSLFAGSGVTTMGGGEISGGAAIAMGSASAVSLIEATASAESVARGASAGDSAKPSRIKIGG